MLRRSPARPWGDEAAHAGEINAWIVIEPDHTVIIRYGRAEMGQGSFTALPMIITEELECDWAKVKPEYASANRNFRERQVYGSLGTGGSREVRETRAMLQQAGASVRERLIAAAANRWGVAPGECTAALSKVMHTPTGRTLRYGELAGEAAEIKLDKEPPIKTPDQYRLMGTAMDRLDIPLKINGSAVYGFDIKVPDRVHAAPQGRAEDRSASCSHRRHQMGRCRQARRGGDPGGRHQCDLRGNRQAHPQPADQEPEFVRSCIEQGRARRVVLIRRI
jgi:isoquinoline 1-oxidoreductase beta subunit